MPADTFEFKLDYSGTGNFSWKTGDANIASQAVKVTHRFPFAAYPQYSDFRLRVIINFNDADLEWLNVSGTGIVDNLKYPLGLFTNSYLNFQNLDLLSTGSYGVDIYYYIEGNIDGYWDQLENRSLSFTLNVTAGLQIKTEKDLYTIFYDKSQNEISGENAINVLNNSDLAFLDFEGDGVTFTAGGIFSTYFELQLLNASLLPNSGEYIINAYLRKLVAGIYQRIYPFKIKVIVIDADVVVSPTSLSFEVKKSIKEIKTLQVSVINPFGKDIAVTAPNWLTIAPAAGNSTFDFSVSNIDPDNLAPGKITGNIEVKYDAVTLLVAVELNVIQFFVHNFQEPYNFCLDQKILKVYKNTESAIFVRITAKMKFRTPSETKELIIPFVIPYFNDQAILDIGKKIHRYFLKNRTSIFEEGTLIYNFDNRVHLYPCEASFVIEELNINQESIYSESLPTVNFYPGKKPKLFPFLTNHPIRSRVYDSKHIFSFISGLVTAEELFDINVVKNGLEAGCIARVKVERQENKITWSDEKRIIAGGQEITYYNIIEGKDLINVQWENQNLAPESFTFKGVSTKPKEYTHLFQDNVFTGETEKFDSITLRTINVSTGFILKSEESLIDEMMMSKFCILEINGNYYRGAPSSSKLVFEDVTKQLIEFDLEFKINGN